jgi:hypothetical protein
MCSWYFAGTFKVLTRSHTRHIKRNEQMTMNDSRASPPRGPYQPLRNNSPTGWIVAAVVAALVVGGVWWTMGNRSMLGLNPPLTTGQTAPMAPTAPPASTR